MNTDNIYGDMYRAKNKNGEYFCKKCSLKYYNENTPRCSCEEWYYFKKKHRVQRFIMIPSLIFMIGYSFFAISNCVNQGRFTYHGWIAIVLMFVVTGLYAALGGEGLGRKKTKAEIDKEINLDRARDINSIIKDNPGGYHGRLYREERMYMDEAFKHTEQNHLSHETKIVLVIVISIFAALFGFLAYVLYIAHMAT